MQQPLPRRLVRRRHWGHAWDHACACYNCGAAVFPLPLRVNPGLHVLRAYARNVTLVNKRTGEVCPRALLFCPVCADPQDVRDYTQFELPLTHEAAAHAARIADTSSKDERRAAHP